MRFLCFVSSLLLLVSNLWAGKMETERWKQDRDKTPLDELHFWAALSENSQGGIVQKDGARMLSMKDGAKIQSLYVHPYPEALNLEAVVSFNGDKAKGGFGFIDFSSSVYYYAYLDAAAGKWILQRGDRKISSVLAEGNAEGPWNSFRKISLQTDFADPKKVTFKLFVDGALVLDGSEERPANMGTTFQIYFGIGDGTEAWIKEITCITQ